MQIRGFQDRKSLWLQQIAPEVTTLPKQLPWCVFQLLRDMTLSVQAKQNTSLNNKSTSKLEVLLLFRKEKEEKIIAVVIHASVKTISNGNIPFYHSNI